MISLIVKGSVEEAKRACDVRGIAMIEVKEAGSTLPQRELYPLTLVKVPLMYERVVMKWFGDSNHLRAPFPTGACLHYYPHTRTERRGGY